MRPANFKRYELEKNCVICNKVFHVPIKKRRSSKRASGLRPLHAITCSPKCSRQNAHERPQRKKKNN